MKRTAIEKLAITIIAFVFIAIIVLLVAGAMFGWELLNNPESFGEWFGRFFEGFENN